MGLRGEGSGINLDALLDQADQERSAVNTAPSAEPSVNLDALLDQAEVEQDPLGELKAGAAGAARGLTFGLSDVGLTASGLVEKETLRGLEEAFPKSSLAGEAVGVFAPTIASGGTSLLARGAVGAGKAVTGVTKLGQIVEGAVARNVLKTASQSGAKKALATAAAKGLGASVEGAFYGAGQVVSEAALGETPPTAEKVLSTIGLSSLFSGAFTGGLSIGGDVIKATSKALAPQLKLLRQNLTGVSKDVERTILDKPEKIADFTAKYGDDVDEGISAAFSEKASELNTARYQLIDNVKTEIDDLLVKNNLTGKSVEISPLLKEIQKVRAKNVPAGTGATKEIDRLSKELTDLERRVISMGKEAAGIAEDAIVDPSTLRMNAGQLNMLKSQYQKSASFSGNMKSSEIEKLYESLAAVTNKQIDGIDKSIRAANSKLSKTIQAQEKLKRFGLYQRGEIDAEKLRKIASTNGPLFNDAKPYLKVLDENWGTDLLEFTEVARAYKALHPKDALARSFTGRSLLESGVGGVVGGALGGPAGAAVGALGGLAIQSPLATRAKIKGINAVEDLLSGKVKNLATSLNANTARFMPENMTPFLAAQAVALGTLERKVKSVDQQIDSSVKAFLNGSPSSASNSNQAFQDSPFDADRKETIGVDKAFTRRMEEISKLASDPVYLDQRIKEAMNPLLLVAPEMAGYLTDTAKKGLNYLHKEMPKRPYPENPFSQTEFIPNDADLYKFARIVNVTENPMSVMKDLRNGSLTRESVDALKEVYPNIYAELQKKIVENAGEKQPKLDFGQLVTLGTLFGVETTEALRPSFFSTLQSNFIEENKEAERKSSTDLNGYKKIAQEGLTTGQRIGG